MRRFFRLPLSTVVCKHIDNEAPHVLSHDFCASCNAHMCYLCSQNHCINLSHDVSSALRTQVPSPRYATAELVQKARLLNDGFLVELALSDVSCICGKSASRSPDAAFCVACGNYTCSADCHTALERDGHCLFHLNFAPAAPAKALRSLTLEGIARAETLNLPVGTLLNRTSRSFLFGLRHAEQGKLYLQRGYMVYGNLLEPTLGAVRGRREARFDWHMNKRRICECNCANCCEKDLHAVVACRDSCNHSTTFETSDMSTEADMLQVCNCGCEFCRSAVTMHVHKLLDCFAFCENQEKL